MVFVIQLDVENTAGGEPILFGPFKDVENANLWIDEICGGEKYRTFFKVVRPNSPF